MALGRASIRLNHAVRLASDGSSLLSDAIRKVERAIEDYVSDRKAVRDDMVAAGDQSVEPLETRLRNPFQARCRVGLARHAILEERKPFGEAEPVVQILRDILLDAPLPLARLGAILRCCANQRRVGVFLLKVFPNRDGLADTLAVVEFERG